MTGRLFVRIYRSKSTGLYGWRVARLEEGRARVVFYSKEEYTRKWNAKRAWENYAIKNNAKNWKYEER